MGREKIKRALLIAGETVEKVLRLVLAKVHDAIKTDLPDTPSSDDLGLAEGVDAVLTTIETNGGGTASTLAYALFRFVLDPWYDAGKDITVRIRAVTSALGTVEDLVDVEVKRIGEDGAPDADLNGTAEQQLTTALADYDFVVDGATLVPGDEVQLRLALSRDDTAGAIAGTITAPKVSVLHSAPDIDAIN
jgi:hypothetical protein